MDQGFHVFGLKTRCPGGILIRKISYFLFILIGAREEHSSPGLIFWVSICPAISAGMVGKYSTESEWAGIMECFLFCL